MPSASSSRDNSMEAVRSALLRHANLTASPAWDDPRADRSNARFRFTATAYTTRGYVSVLI